VNWRDFFKSFGESYLHPRYGAEVCGSMTIEQLYQAFRARMQDEDKDDLK
jgi:hypothetical protein